MAAERDLELLDDYLTNRMNSQDRLAFEQKIKADPQLKAELNLQQQFVEGIRKARIAELKSMMSAVPVPAASTGATLASKITVIALVTTVVGAGIYFTLRPVDEAPAREEIQQIDKAIPEEAPDEEKEPEYEPKEDAPVTSEEGSSEHSPAGTPDAVKKEKPTGIKPTSPKIEVFDPSEDDETNQPSEDIGDIGLPGNSDAPQFTVSVNATDKKHSFHYQFQDGNLVLYGPFEKDLYEVLEFFNAEKRTIFLYHNEQYFHLKQETDKIKPLKAVQDPILLKKLQEYRNQ